MDTIANILYLAGAGLIAYALMKWFREKPDARMLDEKADRKRFKWRYILIGILGFILIVIASVLR